MTLYAGADLGIAKGEAQNQTKVTRAQGARTN